MVKVSFTGLKEVQAWLATLPHGVRVAFMRAYTEYMIGNEQHGLKHEPGYRYVTPFQSFSDDPAKAARQRGWIFTHLDQIGHDNRTHEISNGWQSAETSDWTRVKIANDAPGVGWVMGSKQTRQSRAAGWRRYMDVVASNMSGAFSAGLRAVQAILARGRK